MSLSSTKRSSEDLKSSSVAIPTGDDKSRSMNAMQSNISTKIPTTIANSLDPTTVISTSGPIKLSLTAAGNSMPTTFDLPKESPTDGAVGSATSASSHSDEPEKLKRHRSGSISGRLRAVSDLEESGWIDKVQKGVIKDHIIAGDAKLHAALDKYQQGQPEELQAMIRGGHFARHQSIDLLENLDFDFLTVQQMGRNNHGRSHSFDEDFLNEIASGTPENTQIEDLLFSLGPSSSNNSVDSQSLSLSLIGKGGKLGAGNAVDLAFHEGIQDFSNVFDDPNNSSNMNSSKYGRSRRDSMDSVKLLDHIIGGGAGSGNASVSGAVFNDDVDVDVYDDLGAGNSLFDTNPPLTLVLKPSGGAGNTNKSNVNKASGGGGQRRSQSSYLKDEVGLSSSGVLKSSSSSSNLTSLGHSNSSSNNNNALHLNSGSNLSSLGSGGSSLAGVGSNNSGNNNSSSSNLLSMGGSLGNVFGSSGSAGNINPGGGIPNVHRHSDNPDARGFVGAYSPEQRRKRIEKFLDKRSRRVWTKKVKYDVRKNFADSRLRVKGRFVKKEEENIMRELLNI